jgi:hypothetical protein
MKRLFTFCGIVGALVLLTGCQMPSRSTAPRFDPRPGALWSNELNTVTVKRSLDPTLLWNWDASCR